MNESSLIPYELLCSLILQRGYKGEHWGREGLLALFSQELTLKQLLVSGLAQVKALALSHRHLQELFPAPCLGHASLSRCMAAYIHTSTVSTATCRFHLLCWAGTEELLKVERHSEASFSFTSCRHLPLSDEGHQTRHRDLCAYHCSTVSKWLRSPAALPTALYCRPAELYLETDTGVMFPRASDGVSSECCHDGRAHMCPSRLEVSHHSWICGDHLQSGYSIC